MKNFFTYLFFIIISLVIATGCSKKAEGPKHVFLIVIDTLRADHLGCYGYKAPTSPTLDKLAQEGIIFKKAYSTASSTLEGTISLFNATTALTNKIHTLSPTESQLLSKTALHKYLKEAGFNTLAVVSNPWLKYHQNYFRDGFNDFHFVTSESWEQAGLFNTTSVVTQSVLDFIDTKVDITGRNFFYVHYLDPHDPYFPPVDFGFFSGEVPQESVFVHSISGEEALRARLIQEPDYVGLPIPEPLPRNVFNYKVSRYDSEIRYVDLHLEKLLDKLKAMKILDDCLIIITSDHGEEFLEHGLLKHGFQLYDETIHIPLILYWKGHLDAQSRETIVSGIDIAPTILDFCQLQKPPVMMGNSLLSKKKDEPILFCTHFINQNQRGMRMGKWKLIENVATGEMKVFDMDKDPGERKNLFTDFLPQREDILQSYKKLLENHSVKTDGPQDRKSQQPLEMDTETREQLETLGYL